MQTLAAAEEDIGAFADAEMRLRTVLSLLEKRNQDALVGSSNRTRLGRILLKQRKFAEAEPLLRAALAVRDAKQPNVWTTSVTRYALGGVLVGLGRYAEAEPLLISGYVGLLKNINGIPPVDKGRLNEASEHLVNRYTAWGKPEKTAEWQNKLDELNAARKSARTPEP